MKKRMISLLLCLVLLLGMTPPEAAAAGKPYGSVPILMGDWVVDYMADQILAEIPTAGLDARGQIRAVYDWIITHSKRNDWDGTYYFDQQAVYKAAEAYAEQAKGRLRRVEAVLRQPVHHSLDIETFYDSYYHDDLPVGNWTYDLDEVVSDLAKEMMFKRTGECTNFCGLLIVLLGHLGYDCRMIEGDFINGDGSKQMHKWCCVLVGGQYYWLDVRIDHASYARTGRVAHDYFMVASTSAWEQDHEWNHNYSNQLFAKAASIEKIYADLLSHQHKMVLVPQSPSTCDKDGVLYQYYRCSVCGQCYADEEGTELLNKEYLIIPAAHDWDDWIMLKEPTKLQSGLRERVCRRDSSHVEREKVPALGNPFSDVPAGAYYEPGVAWAVGVGAAKGVSATEFQPEAGCTRGQVVTFLWRCAGKPSPRKKTVPFADVKSGAYYRDAVAWAVDQGITNGTSASTFSPDETCTRGQIVTFLYRAMRSPKVKNTKCAFKDVRPDAYYYKAMLWAVEKGVTNGTSARAFSPNDICTRGQVATFLYRALEES